MMVYIVQSFMKIFWAVLKFREDTIFIRQISKGHNSVKMLVELPFFFSAHRLIMVYISTKFHKNILDGIKVIERNDFHKKKFKGPYIRKECRWSVGFCCLNIV